MKCPKRSRRLNREPYFAKRRFNSWRNKILNYELKLEERLVKWWVRKILFWRKLLRKNRIWRTSNSKDWYRREIQLSLSLFCGKRRFIYVINSREKIRSWSLRKKVELNKFRNCILISLSCRINLFLLRKTF